MDRSGWLLLSAGPFHLDAAAQRVHEVDDVGWRPLRRDLNLLALLLAFQQLSNSILILILTGARKRCM